jgi:hypothetical protein
MLSVVMLIITFYCLAKYYHADCHFFTVMQSVAYASYHIFNVVFNVVILNVVLLGDVHAKYRYADCLICSFVFLDYAWCHYDECRGARDTMSNSIRALI